MVVFAAACAALILATGLGVLGGDIVARFFRPQLLNIIAGSGFLIIDGLILMKLLT
jgi:putative Ca2+/H+ antiporter (TMEM165/GDT1 family)